MDDRFEFLPEPPDPCFALFSEVCHLMEMDIEWLKAEARDEFELLTRYFWEGINRVKDFLEYRDLLHACLRAVDPEGLVRVTDGQLGTGQPNESDHA
jgi:hypothetical protein